MAARNAVQGRGSARRRRAKSWPATAITRAMWDEAPFYEPDWVVPGIAVRGTVTTMSGDLGAGKTMVELGFIAKEGFPTGMRFGRLDLENDLTAVILPRFYELGVEYDMIAEQYRHLQWQITSADEDMDEVVLRVRDLGLDYFSIDATQDALDAFGVNPKENDEVMRWFKAVPERLAGECGIAVFLHDHFGWSDKSHPLGATNKLLNVTISWNLRKDEDFSRDLIGQVTMHLSQKNRLGAAPPQHVFRIGGDGRGRMIFERPTEHELGQTRREHDDRLWTYILAQGPHSQHMLAATVGKKLEMSRQEMRAAFKRLAKEGKIEPTTVGGKNRYKAVEFGRVVVLKSGSAGRRPVDESGGKR